MIDNSEVFVLWFLLEGYLVKYYTNTNLHFWPLSRIYQTVRNEHEKLEGKYEVCFDTPFMTQSHVWRKSWKSFRAQPIRLFIINCSDKLGVKTVHLWPPIFHAYFWRSKWCVKWLILHKGHSKTSRLVVGFFYHLHTFCIRFCDAKGCQCSS